jgi:hypothetical protein
MSEMRMYPVNVEAEVVQSVQRNPRAAVIPPFSFVGELEIGISGFWYPTSTFSLTKASLTASGAGVDTAVVYLLKEEPYTGRPVPIIGFEMPATTTKMVKELDDVVVTPYDKVFVASYSDSAHTGVVVQMVGNMMS